MSSAMKGALNKMTIRQALDEVNATDEQKKNGFDRLLKADKSHRFMPQMKRYVASAAVLAVAVGTAGVGIHFAVVNNQGGPINVSVGNSDTASDSVVVPTVDTKVRSEKSGMIFVDSKAFWTQLGKISYSLDYSPFEISIDDDFDKIFCTDKQVQSEMLDLFDNTIDITEKYIVLTDSNKAVGISSGMSTQEIVNFKNNSDNYFIGSADYKDDVHFYYANKEYFGFDTSEEFVNTVSQVYTGENTDAFKNNFYEFCPDYIKAEDPNDPKSKFGINIDKDFPITELYSAHTQYCTAFYTDDSHDSLILLSLAPKDGSNKSKAYELKYIPMKYVDGKLRIVVSPYSAIYMNVAYYGNFMFNYGLLSEIKAAAKTVDITSVAGDSDNSSKPDTTTPVTTPETTASTTVPVTSATTQTTVTTTTTTTTAATKAPAPTTTAANVTLRMKGSAAYLDKGLLFYYKVDEAFLTNNKVINIKENEISNIPYINTNGSDYTFASLDYGTYVIGGPLMEPTNDSGFTVFTVTEKSSNSIINVDLNTGTLSAGKFKVVSPSDPSTIPAYSEQQYAIAAKSFTYEGHTYIPVNLIHYGDTDINDDIWQGGKLIDTDDGHRVMGSKVKKTPVSDARISIDGNVITGEEVNDYILRVSVANIEGESIRTYSTIMVRKDLTKSSKPKVMLGDAFYYIGGLHDEEKFSMVLKDDNGKLIKNQTVYFYHLDDIDAAKDNDKLECTSDLSYSLYYCIARTDSNGKVQLTTSLYSGKNMFGFPKASDEDYVIKYDRFYEVNADSTTPRLISKIPMSE